MATLKEGSKPVKFGRSRKVKPSVKALEHVKTLM